ncbi:septal ring lytic transglycosylase RlpA family protein [Ningiella sp. W23]|uniref:septal ring lytic transglycosylase RlpA family protein n=1 Tax=Ningiella sp. W23 TaxID=3023715 RepID=UPI0037574811
MKLGILRSVNKHIRTTAFAIIAIVFLQACSTAPSGRYSQKQDTAPQFEYGALDFKEPIPQYEPYNVWTSRPYTVLGGYYTPMLDAKGHEEIGNASWYGQKFHGHTTANGETFDMFALTGAHKTLPLPSFVRVTNLENNRSTTIRVNDRGPFHDDRILDLSYGAAKKLGFHKQGTAKVKIEVVHVSQDGFVTIGSGKTQAAGRSDVMLASAPPLLRPEGSSATSLESSVADSNIGKSASTTQIREQALKRPSLVQESIDDPLMFVQVSASSDGKKVRDLATGLSNLLQVPNSIPKVNQIYRLHLGPLESEQKAQKIIQDLEKLGFDEAFALELTP